tara:strand:- start:1943 stop:2233 length:291 start_codon:yes stop_codon:yes gene_type:complete
VKIDIKTIEKLASLSKLNFSEEELDLISKDMSKMVDFINQLDEIDTEGVEPLIHVNEGFNNWREDEIREMLDQKEALSNSPIKDSTYFKLPKVLDK